MEKQRFTLRCAVYLFLIKDGKILLEKRCNREWCNGQFDVIASHLHGNEDIYSAVVKAAKDEVNIDIDKNDLEIVQVMHRKWSGGEYIDYFFKAEKYSGEIKNNEPEICEFLEWKKFEYPIDNLEEYINVAIKYYINNPENKFTIYGWD